MYQALSTNLKATCVIIGTTRTRQQEQVPGVQKQLSRDVENIASTIQYIDNPFNEKTVRNLVQQTQKQSRVNTIVAEKHMHCSFPITNIIHKNMMPLSSTPAQKDQPKMSYKISLVIVSNRDFLAECIYRVNQEMVTWLNSTGLV